MGLPIWRVGGGGIEGGGEVEEEEAEGEEEEEEEEGKEEEEEGEEEEVEEEEDGENNGVGGEERQVKETKEIGKGRRTGRVGEIQGERKKEHAVKPGQPITHKAFRIALRLRYSEFHNDAIPLTIDRQHCTIFDASSYACLLVGTYPGLLYLDQKNMTQRKTVKTQNTM